MREKRSLPEAGQGDHVLGPRGGEFLAAQPPSSSATELPHHAEVTRWERRRGTDVAAHHGVATKCPLSLSTWPAEGASDWGVSIGSQAIGGGWFIPLGTRQPIIWSGTEYKGGSKVAGDSSASRPTQLTHQASHHSPTLSSFTMAAARGAGMVSSSLSQSLHRR